jgi:hypothetical protein
MRESIALAKAPGPVLRERGMLRYRIVKSYPTKAAVGQVQMHFFTKAALIDTGLTIAGGGFASKRLLL